MTENIYPNVRERIAFSDEKMKKVPLFDTPRCMSDLYCAKPGQGQRVHSHDGEDKLFYVLDGVGEFQIGAETYTLGPGAAAIAPAGVEHGMDNPGPDNLVVLVTITPPIAH